MPRALPPTAAFSLAPCPCGLFTGTSGWAYPTWKPGFYPATVPSRAFLHHYAACLTSVEVNYTFSTLPTREQLQGWLDATPPGFRFSFKAPQRITHFQRLLNSEETLAEFLAAIKPAQTANKLGALLFQLPPNFKPDYARLSAFLKLPTLKLFPQLVFEFRNEAWFTEATYDILRRHNAALCIADSGTLITPDVRTADFAYYRLRKPGGYGSKRLTEFAQRFTTLTQQGEVFAYFKHEDEPTGPLCAVTAMRRAAKLTTGAQ